MSEKGMNEISKRAKDQYSRAKKAAEQHNNKYAVEMIIDCLKSEPGFYEAREFLRNLQFKIVGTTPNSFKKIWAQIATFFPINVNGPKLLKAGKATEALELGELAMMQDPTLSSTLKFLQKSAKEAKFDKTELSLIELIEKYYPKDIDNLKAKAEYYKVRGEAQKMLDVCHEICKAAPNDMKAQSDMKAATAEAAMKGKWQADKETSYQDLIVDKDAAQALQQKEMTVARDEDTLNNLIAVAEKEAAEGDSIAAHKRLGEYYLQAKNYTKSLENYDKLVELSGTMEPTIANAILKVKTTQLDSQIVEATAAGDTAKATELEAAKDTMRFEQAQDLVQRFPNNPEYHFDLGSIFYDREMFSEALSELQQSQRNPMYKNKACRLMGMCFHNKGQFDLAIDQYQNIIGSMLTMNGEKKETLYSLGLAYEATGKDEQALTSFKEIYQADVGYKDVADKIDAFYKKQNA